jgi:hypothetical protein
MKAFGTDLAKGAARDVVQLPIGVVAPTGQGAITFDPTSEVISPTDLVEERVGRDKLPMGIISPTHYRAAAVQATTVVEACVDLVEKSPGGSGLPIVVESPAG